MGWDERSKKSIITMKSPGLLRKTVVHLRLVLIEGKIFKKD